MDRQQGAELEGLRAAVIYRLVSQLGNPGRTKLQKLIYFLEESIGLPLEYRFKMHHYGPYAEELERDVARLSEFGFLKVFPDIQGYGFHIVAAGDPSPDWRDLATRFDSHIDRVLGLLGELDASSLELRATIHFVQKLSGARDRGTLARLVEQLKPKFGHRYIRGALSDLESSGLLAFTP
jgi:uncharacterized protein YwgA